MFLYLNYVTDKPVEIRFLGDYFYLTAKEINAHCESARTGEYILCLHNKDTYYLADLAPLKGFIFLARWLGEEPVAGYAFVSSLKPAEILHRFLGEKSGTCPQAEFAKLYDAFFPESTEMELG
jgi:hypothetical protein